MPISAKTKICLIIGDPIEHSLSPLIHNAAYKALGIEEKFVFVAARVKIENLAFVVKAVRVMGIRGLTCTMPHKVKIVKYLDKIDEIAKEIGAVNTVVNENGKLKGYNTDWIGAKEAIKKVTKIRGKKVGIIGAGGAARAIAFAMKKEGAQIKIFNRDLKEAKKLAKKYECSFGSFENLDELKDFDIIINATPLGMGPYKNISPVKKEIFSEKHVVLDSVYIPFKTKMLKEAEEKGAKIIPGIEMLLYQAVPQFTLYTKRKPPIEAMRKAVEEFFKNEKEI